MRVIYLYSSAGGRRGRRVAIGWTGWRYAGANPWVDDQNRAGFQI